MKKKPVMTTIEGNDPLWYKNAIIYEVHVKAFCDSNGDGIGDFPGLTQKLDYIQDLGVNTIWVLPFYPSPQRDDGYDISDYMAVHPSYGTINDFKNFLKEAHQRGIRVITELVINHTSDAHPWFQASRRAPPGSAKRNFYVWSDDDKRFQDARIIFTDTENSNWAWDPIAKSYYWHRFFSHQPDLNFHNPQVIKLLLRVMCFWLDMGVDGLRLDAIPYLCEREGTTCENLSETHEIIKTFRRELDKRYQNRIFLAEANQWPEDVAEYFADGDECHMAYHFPLMPRMYMALALEDRYPIVEIMKQTPEIPSNCQWAIFLRNHDELTLEMVTSKERDYMYQTYASDTRAKLNLGIRRRLAPLMENDRAKIELMYALLLSMPGSPILYYGDEIGMGDNLFLGDRNGVRTPMQWSSDRNGGFSTADPERLFLPPVMSPVSGFQAINVEAQSRNPSSLLNWMRRLIAVRKNSKAFGEGNLEFVKPANRHILAYFRTHHDTTIFCIANLSRRAQPVQLDLSHFKWYRPVEMLGRNAFPQIGNDLYQLSLPGYGFFWFELVKDGNGFAWNPPEEDSLTDLPVLVVKVPVETKLLSDSAKVLDGKSRKKLEDEVMPQYAGSKRWFSGKGKGPAKFALDLLEFVSIPGCQQWVLSLFSTEFQDQSRQRYSLPFNLGWEKFGFDPSRVGKWVMAKVRQQTEVGFFLDSLSSDEFCHALLLGMGEGRKVKLENGELVFSHTHFLGSLEGPERLPVRRPNLEQSHTSVFFGEKLILKWYRQIQNGMNPEFEMVRFLAQEKHYKHVAQMAGAVEFAHNDGRVFTLAILQELVENQGDGWAFTLNCLDRFLEYCLLPKESAASAASAPMREMYHSRVEVLGKRIGEMHSLLAEKTSDAAFKPEPIEDSEWKNWTEGIVESFLRTVKSLDRRLSELSEDQQQGAKRLAREKSGVIQQIRGLCPSGVGLQKTRYHGDLHLGQVLLTANDFVVIDFEGEPIRNLEERRKKYCPLRDVAGMVRSFNYATNMALKKVGHISSEAIPHLSLCAQDWEALSVERFLKGYLSEVSNSPAQPAQEDDFHRILQLFCIEKALYEFEYELNHRPDWVGIPLTWLTRNLLVTE